MKLLNRSIAGLGLTLAIPASTHAQKMAPDNLVGTWAYVVFILDRGVVQEYLWTFRADGTMTEHVETLLNDGRKTPARSLVSAWHLAGDSLRLGEVYYKILAQDRGQSFLMRRFKEGSNEFQCTPGKFERVDTTKPHVMPTRPSWPTTLKETDLIGTWMLARSSNQVDTLILRSDSTWIRISPTADDRKWEEAGGWRLFPGESGDYLVLHTMMTSSTWAWRATLQNGRSKELALQRVGWQKDAKQCNEEVPDIWKRAIP